jgi:hypothetical protein
VNIENSKNIDLFGEHNREQQNIDLLGEYRKHQKYRLTW